jgi:hypothetical protein
MNTKNTTAEPLMSPDEVLDLAFAEMDFQVGLGREKLHVQSLDPVEGVDGATYIQVAVSDWPARLEENPELEDGAAREVIYHYRIQYIPVQDVPPPQA